MEIMTWALAGVVMGAVASWGETGCSRCRSMLRLVWRVCGAWRRFWGRV